MLLGQREDLADARRDQNAFPYPVLAGTERSANFCMHFGYVDALGIERAKDRSVAFFEQGDQQVFGADVIVTVVPALLLGYPKDAPRGRI